MNHEIKSDDGISIWLFTGCAMIFLMILIGGVTRLTGSGLSIVEWNVISGTIPPLNESEWSIAFEKYKQFPQYQKINYKMDLDGFKNIFFWEYIHRLWGRIIGIVFIIPFFVFYLKGRIQGALRKRLLWILLLGVLQGAVGWFMVKSGLVDNPNVSHYRLATHLVLALFLLSVVFITAVQTSSRFIIHKAASPDYRLLLKILILLAFIQIVYGAFVAGMKAGYAYNTFPKMGNDWFPDGLFMIEPFYKDLLENGITLQFIHRWLGLTLLLLTSVLWTFDRFYGNGIHKKEFFVLFAFLFFQAILGILTLLFHVPLSAAIAHQALGIVVFIYIVMLNYRFNNLYI